MTTGEEPPTTVEGDRTPADRAARRLRARWLEPSPPLAVDDEPAWSPSPDEPEDEVGSEAVDARPAAQRVAH